jgi:hypothetical protein
MKGMNRAIIIALAALASGCGVVNAVRDRDLVAKSNAAFLACESRFPVTDMDPSNGPARARCENEAKEIVRSIVDQDLFEAMQAANLATGERLAKKQITVIQAREFMANKRAELQSEAQRRHMAGRAVRAQEAIADSVSNDDAFSGPFRTR